MDGVLQVGGMQEISASHRSLVSLPLTDVHLEVLEKCGISRGQAWQRANTRKGYWRIADSWILSIAINNERLKTAGYPSLMGYWAQRKTSGE